MPVERQTAQSLAAKVREFRATLSEDEGQGLDALLELAYRAAETSAAAAASDDDARSLLDSGSGGHALDEVREALRNDAGESRERWTPAATAAVTTVTVIASHPGIGCGGGGDSGPGPAPTYSPYPACMGG